MKAATFFVSSTKGKTFRGIRAARFDRGTRFITLTAEEAANPLVEVTAVAYDDPGYPFARVYLHDRGPEVITPE